MELPSLSNCRCWSLKATAESERVSEFPSGPGKPQSIYLYIMHNNNNNPPLVSRVLQMGGRTLLSLLLYYVLRYSSPSYGDDIHIQVHIHTSPKMEAGTNGHPCHPGNHHVQRARDVHRRQLWFGCVILRRSFGGPTRLQYFHAALFLGRPDKFSHLLPDWATRKNRNRKIVPSPLDPNTDYIIHFSGLVNIFTVAAGGLGVVHRLFLPRGIQIDPGARICIEPFHRHFGRSKGGCQIAGHMNFGPGTTVFSPEDRVQRAIHLLGRGFGMYDLLNNNCQHFVNFCKYGKARLVKEQLQLLSRQIPGGRMVLDPIRLIGREFLGINRDTTGNKRRRGHPAQRHRGSRGNNTRPHRQLLQKSAGSRCRKKAAAEDARRTYTVTLRGGDLSCICSGVKRLHLYSEVGVEAKKKTTTKNQANKKNNDNNNNNRREYVPATLNSFSVHMYIHTYIIIVKEDRAQQALLCLTSQSTTTRKKSPTGPSNNNKNETTNK
eukprot:gene1464-853_t